MGNFANKTFIGEIEITKEMRYKDLLCTLISEDFLGNKKYVFKCLKCKLGICGQNERRQ